MRAGVVFNPFPGLRPFEANEDHLFFGREKEIDQLLRRLRSTRFVSVVGTSGSGKSSLVRCGLISALYGGFMVQAGSAWRVAKFRPSDDPIGNLAASLNDPGVLGTEGELASTNRILLEASLRRGSLGLVEAYRQRRIPPDEKLLVVVDQFEELFRFRRSRQVQNSKDEAIAFVKLLLEAAQTKDVPIYIVLTMRSDFIGDCIEYPGLPEAVNDGQYLIPRMTRNEIRSAITGPVAVAGGQITQRLVLRLLNDLGDDQDQLPVLQHALMRSWDYWYRNHQSSEPLDISDYDAVGTIAQALSLHAEEAYEETNVGRAAEIAERTFKALTDTFSDARGVRRPTSISHLARICEASENEIIEVIEVFRRPGRSFLTPPFSVPLESRSVIDISHESLMRCWARLIRWAEDERASASFFVRLAQAASWFAKARPGYGAILNCSWGFDGGNKIVRQPPGLNIITTVRSNRPCNSWIAAKRNTTASLPTRSANKRRSSGNISGPQPYWPSSLLYPGCLPILRAGKMHAPKKTSHLPKMPSMRCCLPPEALKRESQKTCPSWKSFGASYSRRPAPST